VPDLRAAGQDSEIIVAAGNRALTTITNIKNVEMTFNFELKEEDFLGEFATRYDEFFKGVTGNIEMQVSSPEQFEILQRVKDRAQRRIAAVSLSLKTTLTFPSTGFRKRFLLSNLAFGNFPLRLPARTEYITFGLDFGTGEAEII